MKCSCEENGGEPLHRHQTRSEAVNGPCLYIKCGGAWNKRGSEISFRRVWMNWKFSRSSLFFGASGLTSVVVMEMTLAYLLIIGFARATVWQHVGGREETWGCSHRAAARTRHSRCFHAEHADLCFHVSHFYFSFHVKPCYFGPWEWGWGGSVWTPSVESFSRMRVCALQSAAK